MSNPTGFASVKLPAALVQQAREAAQPLRRSVAGQIEYWATLGRVAEHTGLTVQEAHAAIEGYEAAARKAGAKERRPGSIKGVDPLASLKQRVLAVSADGTLQSNIRQFVGSKRRLVRPRVAA